MFERFSPDARRVVVLAQEEARLLGHNYIGTEHLLLGLLRQEASSAVRALEAAGLNLATTRDMVAEVIGRGDTEPHGHIPFTPRAKKVLELSLRESLELRHQHIGPEHLLLALIREGQGVAASVLTRHGALLPVLRRDVMRRARQKGALAFARDDTAVLGRLSADVLEGLVAARRLARAQGASEVGTEHLLAGMLVPADGRARQVLSPLGVTAETLWNGPAPAEDRDGRVPLASPARRALDGQTGSVGTGTVVRALLADEELRELVSERTGADPDTLRAVAEEQLLAEGGTP